MGKKIIPFTNGKIDSEFSRSIVDKYRDYCDRLAQIIDFADNTVNIAVKNANLEAENFYLEPDTVENVMKWICGFGSDEKDHILRYISDNLYIIKLFLEKEETGINIRYTITRRHQGKEVYFDSENKEWTSQQYMTQQQHDNIMPGTAEHHFIKMVIDAFGPQTDLEYGKIKRKNGKLIRVARRLPADMMMFNFLNPDGEELDGSNDPNIIIGLQPMNGDVVGLAIKQEETKIQVCQFVQQKEFSGKRANYLKVVAEFEDQRDAVEYIMFVMDHFYSGTTYVFPLSENAYVNVSQDSVEKSIIYTRTGEITDRDEIEWKNLSGFLSKNRLRDICWTVS